MGKNPEAVCPFCGLATSVNYTGRIRKHRCTGTNTRTVRLSHGGDVQIAMRLNMFRLTARERVFVSAISDELPTFPIARPRRQARHLPHVPMPVRLPRPPVRQHIRPTKIPNHTLDPFRNQRLKPSLAIPPRRRFHKAHIPATDVVRLVKVHRLRLLSQTPTRDRARETHVRFHKLLLLFSQRRRQLRTTHGPTGVSITEPDADRPRRSLADPARRRDLLRRQSDRKSSHDSLLNRSTRSIRHVTAPPLGVEGSCHRFRFHHIGGFK